MKMDINCQIASLPFIRRAHKNDLLIEFID